MKRVSYKAAFLFLAVGLALGGCKTTSTKPGAPQVVFHPAKLDAIDAAIERGIAAGKAPGAVVRIESAGAVYQKSFAAKSVEPESLPMTADTIFDSASLTKVIATTPAIMLLVEPLSRGQADDLAKQDEVDVAVAELGVRLRCQPLGLGQVDGMGHAAPRRLGRDAGAQS